MKMKLYWEKKKKEMRKQVGQERINSKGDVEVRIKPGMRNSCWKEKRLVLMDKSLMETRGFPLLSCEGVLHKNGDRHDLRPENLELAFLRKIEAEASRRSGASISWKDFDCFVGRWIATYGMPPEGVPFR